jgi:RNase P protein component
MRSLRRKTDFDRVYGEGVKRVGQYLVLYLLPAEDDAKAVVASRKIGNAVKRNRAKRLLRKALADVVFPAPGSSARLLRRFFPIRCEGVTSQDQARGLWIVAVARQAILSAKSPDVCNEVEKLLQ